MKIADPSTMATLAYIVYTTTPLGFAIWNWQMSRRPLTRVAPYTLLVPCFGLTTTALRLDEPFAILTVGASLLVIPGVAINQSGGSVRFLVQQRQRGP